MMGNTKLLHIYMNVDVKYTNAVYCGVLYQGIFRFGAS